MAAMNARQSIFIDLSAEEIYPYMSDLENLVDWSSTIIAVRKIASGTPVVGSRIRATFHFLGKWLEITFELVEYDPPHYLTIKSISGSSPCLFCFQFETHADGGTFVSLEASIQLTGGVIDLPEAVVTSAIRRQFAYDLCTLKDMLEARSALCQIAD